MPSSKDPPWEDGDTKVSPSPILLSQAMPLACDSKSVRTVVNKKGESPLNSAILAS